MEIQCGSALHRAKCPLLSKRFRDLGNLNKIAFENYATDLFKTFVLKTTYSKGQVGGRGETYIYIYVGCSFNRESIRTRTDNQ